MTLVELKERLSSVEETDLIDLLAVNSAQIVEAFSDLIEEKMDYLEGVFDE